MDIQVSINRNVADVIATDQEKDQHQNLKSDVSRAGKACWQRRVRRMPSSGRGIALEYRSRGGHILAVVVYFPADQDLDVVRSLLAWALGVMAPRRGVYTLMLGDLNANPGWAAGFRQATAGLTILWEDFLQDTGLARCKPAAEVPTWTDGRGCVGVIDHVLHGPVQKEGRLWVDETSPFPSDHRPVVWDARDVQDPEDRPPVRLRARHFQIRDPGVTGVYHTALSAAHQERGPRPGDLADLYAYFLSSTIRAVERAHGPPREFWELPGRVDQVHRQLQEHAKRCPRWWESLDTLKERLDLRQDLAEAWEVGNLQRYLAHLPEVAPFTRPSRGGFHCLYGPARTPPVQPRFSAHVDVAPRARAKVALDQVRHRHQKALRELAPGDVRALTGWVTPAQPLGLPSATYVIRHEEKHRYTLVSCCHGMPMTRTHGPNCPVGRILLTQRSAPSIPSDP